MTTTNLKDYQRELEERYSAPMPWVGVYVAAASLVCTFAMAADVFHGFRHKKLWFPNKYFTLNAASLTLIAIAMKLPVDLNNPMPRPVDQIGKISSISFMCIMMANFLPSLGPMTSSDLLMNITALGILVITVIVNVSIQLSTGVIIGFISILDLIFMIFLLFLLTLLTSSALMVPISKKIFQFKHLEMRNIAFTDRESHNSRTSRTVERLIQDVSIYSIMAETSNPQFVMACSPTCSASGTICLLVVFFLVALFLIIFVPHLRRYNIFFLYLEGESDYKWSVIPIIVIQSVGAFVGTVAPFIRLFTPFSFKLPLKQSKRYLNVYRIEKYWTQTLVDWKSSCIDLPNRGLKCQKAIHELKNRTLNTLIKFQIFMVRISKITQLITIFLVIMFSNCWYCCTWLVRKLMTSVCAPKCQEGLESEYHDNAMLDLSHYVLQLEDEVEFSKATLAMRFSKAVHQLIQNAERKHPSNLMKLLIKSKGFEGVAKFDNSKVPPLHSLQHPNSWSFVVVTLTSIVIALQTGKNGNGECLLRGINEGLQLVRLIEESLDPDEENLVNVRKAASYMWFKVEVYSKWMDEDLHDKALERKKPDEILKWLSDKAQKILMESKKSVYLGPADSGFLKIVAANSMYRISQSILLNHEGSEVLTGKMLFDEVYVMIADILSACLSNIPSVIARKCDAKDIGKREENVKIAAQLVGQTKEIMKFLEHRELPSLDANKLGNIDEWHAFLNPSSNNETDSSSSSQLLSISVE